ncbi:MAG: ABC transporter ATP-binding protein [Spirochaetaceae bacterium]|nr:MAG: ABC transporter ATP-binding protein [Spirochaetaceae bacterium]
MSTSIVAIDNVEFTYEGRHEPVLRGLNLSVRQGSVTALLGPNGSGKTTLLNLCLGWLKPQAGQVLLDGTPLQRIPRKQMGRTVSLVPQDEHLPFEYSVLEYVLLGRAPYLSALQMPDDSHVEAAHRALREIGADRWADRGITTLSAGERQLVMTARSLAQQPRLLLMDEPSSHLDLANTARLLRRIAALAHSGVTVLLTTHDPRVASACATEVALMRDGRILFDGPTHDALTAELLSATYGIEVEVHAVGRHRMVTWS